LESRCRIAANHRAFHRLIAFNNTRRVRWNQLAVGECGEPQLREADRL